MRYINRQPVAYFFAIALGCLNSLALASKNSDDVAVKPIINTSKHSADDSQPVQHETADMMLTTGGVQHTYTAQAPLAEDSTRTAPQEHQAEKSDTAIVGFYGELIVSGKATGVGLPGGYGYSKVIGGGQLQDMQVSTPVSVFSSDR